MPRLRQLVLYKAPTPGTPPGRQTPLGTRREILTVLEPFNTGPDGSPDTTLAYGPGFTAQFPLNDAKDDVNQVLLSINEEEIAWPVLQRLCKTTGWKLMDPDSGRTFG